MFLHHIYVPTTIAHNCIILQNGLNLDLICKVEPIGLVDLTSLQHNPI